jgi:hypothetical protein
MRPAKNDGQLWAKEDIMPIANGRRLIRVRRCYEWWEDGAPQPTKMGNIASRQRYDEMRSGARE